MASRTSALVDQLKTLGLTASESKAYMAVVKLGPCRVTEISREAKLQRTEIYRLMSRLATEGLVNETLDRPKRYQASSIEGAISILAEKTLNRLRGATEASRSLVTKLEMLRIPPEQREEPQVRVITGFDNIRRNFFELLTSAQSEVWVAASRNQLEYAGRSTIPKAVATITSKQIKARVIVEVDQSNVRRLSRVAPLIEIRHHQPVHVQLHGIDDRAVVMGLTPPTETDPSRFSEVLITHPSYVKAIRDLFNALWKQAIPLASRFAMLQGRRLLPSQTRVIQGREELYAQLPAEWRRKTRKTIANMTTRYGPVRILHGARETFWEASRRGVKLQLVCDVCPENVSAVRELATIAEIRHNNLPLSVSIGILDQSEALIHYVQPDTPDLTSPTDVAIVTTNRNSIHDLRCIFDLVWDHSIPFERRLQELSRTQKAVAGITRRPTWARSRHVH